MTGKGKLFLKNVTNSIELLFAKSPDPVNRLG